MYKINFFKEFKYGTETIEDKRFIQIWLVVLFVSFILMFLLSKVEIKEVKPEQIIAKMPERFARLILQAPQEKKVEQKGIKIGRGKGEETEKAEVVEKPVKKEIAGTGEGAGEGGGGPKMTAQEARTRIAQRRGAIGAGIRTKGILGIISGKGVSTRGRGVVDILKYEGGGGVTEDIGGVLEKIGGLKTSGGGIGEGIGGEGGIGGGLGGSRRGEKGGGGGGVADLLGGVKGPEIKGLEKKGRVEVSVPTEISGDVAARNVRTSEEIRKVVLENMPGIKYLYTRELKKNPELHGKIIVKFTITTSGNITYCEVVSSTINCPALEQDIVLRIKRWKFDSIQEGEVTVTYPFVFMAEM